MIEPGCRWWEAHMTPTSYTNLPPNVCERATLYFANHDTNKDCGSIDDIVFAFLDVLTAKAKLQVWGTPSSSLVLPDSATSETLTPLSFARNPITEKTTTPDSKLVAMFTIMNIRECLRKIKHGIRLVPVYVISADNLQERQENITTTTTTTTTKYDLWNGCKEVHRRFLMSSASIVSRTLSWSRGSTEPIYSQDGLYRDLTAKSTFRYNLYIKDSCRTGEIIFKRNPEEFLRRLL